MHAIKRTYLAPFVATAAILLTAVPAARFATSVASPAATATHASPLAGILRACPEGTNWDNLKQICD
jgi:hypothetical protein